MGLGLCCGKDLITLRIDTGDISKENWKLQYHLSAYCSTVALYCTAQYCKWQGQFQFSSSAGVRHCTSWLLPTQGEQMLGVIWYLVYNKAFIKCWNVVFHYLLMYLFFAVITIVKSVACSDWVRVRYTVSWSQLQGTSSVLHHFHLQFV